MSDLVFVKLGGSIVTDKRQPFAPRPDAIRRLAREFRLAREARPALRVVLGHGSGSFGHVVASTYHVRQGIGPEGDWQGYAETGAAAARLNRVVTDLLLEVGVPVVSVQPSASARCRGGQLAEMAVQPICSALDHGLVPLVYGDVAFDEQQGCTIVSTEELLAHLAREIPRCAAWGGEIQSTRMVMVGEVDGVHDRDPLQDAGATRIERITPASFAQLKGQLGGSHAVDVTGGMLTKVQEMVALVAQGDVDRVHLISGLREGALMRVLLDGQESGGTLIERGPEVEERN